jgi:hypothetical protein
MARAIAMDRNEEFVVILRDTDIAIRDSIALFGV